MSYRVEHVRCTLECDACGVVDVREARDDKRTLTAGWSAVTTVARNYFCCPACLEKVNAVLEHKERAQLAAEHDRRANCDHDYAPKGLLQRCTKCGTFR